MHVGFSLVTLGRRRPTGTGTYTNALLAEFAQGRGPDRTTVLLGPAQRGNYQEFEGEFMQVAELWSPPRLTQVAYRASALSPPRLRRRRSIPLMKELDLLHYPLTIPVPRTQVRTVVTLHDVQHHDLPDMFSRGQRLWRRASYDAAARRATVVITISRHAKGRIVEQVGIDPDRVEVVPLAVDPVRYAPEASESDEQALSGYKLPRRFVFYPAAIWPHKNHQRLLAAFADIDDPDLEMVLTGPAFSGLDPLRESISRYKLEERVRYLGFVPTAAVAALYRRATAMIFPSQYEGFGVPTLEAMACGCPVASSSATALAETCGDAALMFDPTSSESIAGAMERIVNDDALRRQLRAAGSRRAGEFTWARAARSHRHAFERALTLDPPAAAWA